VDNQYPNRIWASIRSRKSLRRAIIIQSQRNLMYHSEEDLRITKEVCTRFDEFITAPQKSDFRCHRCQSFIEYGPLPTTARVMAYRCDCRIGSKGHRRVERVFVEKYEKLTPDDWDQIINAI
jgi:hypothetical protein